MASSLLIGGVTAGLHIRIAAPEGFHPTSLTMAEVRRLEAESGGSATVITDPVEAVIGADVIATDSWKSMGQQRNDQELVSLRPYQVNSALLAHTGKSTIVMHCMPAHRGVEITDEMMDGPASAVWDQAENRLHTEKALLVWLFTQGVQ